MRFISFHVKSFHYKITKKGRSKIIEELNDNNKEGSIENGLVLFISIEKKDESDGKIIQKVVNEIKKICSQIKVKEICIVPYAHLFGELSSLSFGYETLKKLESALDSVGYNILRMPFGWFSEFEMSTKGHPLSRISRKI